MWRQKLLGFFAPLRMTIQKGNPHGSFVAGVGLGIETN
jgi:hypothetical protein